jgi:hypothetical protein
MTEDELKAARYISVGEQEFQGTSVDDYLDIDLRLNTEDGSGTAAINFVLIFQRSVDGGGYAPQEELQVRLAGVTATPWNLPLTFRRIINIGTSNYRTRFLIQTVGNPGMIFDPNSSMTFKHFKSNVGITSADSNWTGIVP